jgi:hypothetical protein
MENTNVSTFTCNTEPSSNPLAIRTRACQRRIDYFIKSQKITSLQETLNIPIETLNIKLKHVCNSYISFNITFKKNMYYNVNFINLPEELNDIINSFLTETISIDIYITTYNNYPFAGLRFYIQNITCNKDFGYYLKEFYNYRIEKYNEKLNEEWCAAWAIDKNILDFVSTIFSDFDTVLHETFLYINDH